MATPTLARNKSRTFNQCISILMQPGGLTHDKKFVGAAKIERWKRRIWVCAGQPSGAAPTGMVEGDLIHDTTNDKVYRYITGTTYVDMSATS